MKEEELKLVKDLSKLFLEDARKRKQELGLNPIVQDYLNAIDTIYSEQKTQNYLEQLEIGYDGTVFSPYMEYSTKSSCNTHFGLSQILEHAFDLILNTSNTALYEEIKINFENFYDYVENAKEILTDMRYYPGDRLVSNKLNLEIYENPKNYSVVDFKSLLPMTDNDLQKSYTTAGIYICGDAFHLQKPIKYRPTPNNNLTIREKEAFYGHDAKIALGILPVRVRTKKK